MVERGRYPIHKLKGHEGGIVGHPLWLHIVLEVQVGGQRGARVEGLATGAQLGAKVGSMGGLVVPPAVQVVG